MTPVLASEAAGAGFPVLSAIVLTPILGAVLIALTPRSRPDVIRWTAILAAILTAALTFYVLGVFDAADPGFQLVDKVTWIEQFDIKFYLGVDGISLFLVVLTGVLFPIALFAARPHHDEKGYYAWLTLLMAGCMGVFLALDLFLFFIAFELTLIPLYFLIGQWGHGRRVYAANKFFLYTMTGSIVMLIAIVAMAFYGTGERGPSFDLIVLAESGEISQTLGRVLFLGFALAFAIKVPLVPFHTWLPDAHTEAPTAGSIDLAGILLKLGSYGFLRFGLYLFPEAAVWAAPALLVLSVIGIIYGAIVAAMQKNLKRLVAYSSVSHMGFAVAGIFSLTVIGLQGSLMVMINHGITTGALFILLGYIYERRHTYEIDKLRGLQTVAPVLAGLFTLMMLASIGLPGLNGFVGEFLVLVGTFISHRWYAVVAAAGVIFAALYLLWAYQRVFHGEVDDDNRTFPDLRLSERFVLVPLVILVFFLGLYPKPVLDRMEPSVQRLLTHVERQVPGFTPATNEPTPEIALEEHGTDDAEHTASAADGSDGSDGSDGEPAEAAGSGGGS